MYISRRYTRFFQSDQTKKAKSALDDSCFQEYLIFMIYLIITWVSLVWVHVHHLIAVTNFRRIQEVLPEAPWGPSAWKWEALGAQELDFKHHRVVDGSWGNAFFLDSESSEKIMWSYLLLIYIVYRMNFPWCNIVQLHSVVSWDFQENWIPSKNMDTKN